MRKFLAALLFPLCAYGLGDSYIITSGNSYLLTVDPATPGLAIPLDFVGVSLETSALVQTPSLNNNANLKAILSALGITGHIRFGGNTSDSTVPSTSRVTDAANFVASFGSGWNAVYGVSCTLNDPTTEAALVAAFDAVLGAKATYQIGNEPNFYGSGPCSGTPATRFANYSGVWQPTHDAITGTTAAAKFAGPDVGITTNAIASAVPPDTWIGSNFAASLGSQSTLLSAHIYGATATGVATVDIPAAWNNSFVQSEISGLVANASVIASGLSLRLTESGSISGASNTVTGTTLGASLYDLWEMILLASNGWKGVDFHQGDAISSFTGYSPVVGAGGGTYTAQTTLYAMVLFDYLVGGRILPATTTLPSSLPYLAVQIGGVTKILIVNKNYATYNATRLASSVSFTSASVLQYTAPGCASTSVALGAATIAQSGSLAPIAFTVPKIGTTATVNIPPCSAVLATLT